MIAHQGRHSFAATIHTLVSIFLASCTAEYIPKTITNTPGYALLAGVSHVPAPIVFSPNQQDWEGIDGAWNTFSLRVGSQQKNISVLVSTTNQQVWVVNAQACTVNSMGGLADAVSQIPAGQCESSRGYLFNTSESITWYETGYYGLQAPMTLGVDTIGLFGLDTVTIGLSEEGEGPAVSNTTIGTIGTYATKATPEFWLGYIGLQSKPSTFLQQPSRPSYITGLFEMQGIPSQSFGYTAGAQYRKSSATYLGSLTLGGYDASRFVSNSIFFAPDTERNLVVGLTGLTAQTTSASNIDLLNGTNIDLRIDSTIAEIWLPINVCKIFEEVFGLIYDNVTDLYLVDVILHQILLELNPSITFTLRQPAKSSATGTVRVTLPYDAFDLQAKPPYRGLNETKRYFPLRRGANDSQWTLGRTFLQEAYLTVDWERSQFQVYPCDWTGKQSEIVAIVSPRYGNAVGASDVRSSNLSIAAIVGIAIGVTAAVIVASVTAWWVWRRQHRKAHGEYTSFPAPPNSGSSQTPGGSTFTSADGGSLVFPKAELPADSNISKDENPFADTNPVEHPVYEMMGDIPVNEAGGRQLSEKETMIVRGRNINGVDPYGTPTLSMPNTAGKSARAFSAEEIVMSNHMYHRNRASFSTVAAQHGMSTGLPLPQAQREGPCTGELPRRRFSYES